MGVAYWIAARVRRRPIPFRRRIGDLAPVTVRDRHDRCNRAPADPTGAALRGPAAVHTADDHRRGSQYWAIHRLLCDTISGCRILAIEPDESNMHCSARTRRRIRTSRPSVGRSDPPTGRVVPRRSRPWASRLYVADSGAGTPVPAFTVDALMTSAGWRSLDLLKMDIEGPSGTSCAGVQRGCQPSEPA
jgi:hypothetical protein